MAEVTFVGTGEATDPDLPNTSILYRGARVLLLDCGYSVPQAFWKVSRDPGLLDAIFISHSHGDHTFGLPGLLLWMREQGRTDPLRIVCSPSTGAVVRNVVEIAYPGLLDEGLNYPVELVPVGDELALGPLTLRVAESAHSTENLALRIDEGDRAFCYSGDGGLTDATRALYQGADLLAHECYDLEPRTQAHASVRELLAAELDVRQLAVVHVAVAAKSAVRALLGSRPGVAMPSPGDRLTVG